MRTSSILYCVVSLASIAVSAVPSGPARMILEKREDMHCSSHNWSVMCATTHRCSGGRVVRINPASTLNSDCARECSCGTPVGKGGRRILGEIDHNTVNGKNRRIRRAAIDEEYLYE
ncbi:hypothetical protein B0H34DRAFT_463190 [Crassisporium funariophilum]|nr:hypothetical protein B0H34DRAFT_463190 [Crassisporium funariophilum]